MANSVKMPSQAAVKKVGKDALVAGAVGGAGVALGAAMLGPTLGAPLGAIIAGAAVGGSGGEIVAINGVMDGMVSLFMGGFGGESGNAGVM